MKNVFFIIAIFSCVCVQSQTYYYERITDNADKDGHYITFGNGTCYDSDKDGCSEKHGVIKYVGDMNEKHKFRGSGYFGNSIYWFSIDYSQLEIFAVDNGEQYVYKKLSGPSQYQVSLRKSKSVDKSNVSSGNQPTISSSSMPTSAPLMYDTKPLFTVRKVWENCWSCGGTGLCSSCHGTGIDPYTKTGHCYVCNGTGKCSGCRGERGHYKEVYE